MSKKLAYPFDKDPKRRTPQFYPVNSVVLAFDVVGFTKRTTNETMRTYLQTIDSAIEEIMWNPFNWNENYDETDLHNTVIMIPTGDGYAIAFLPDTDTRQVLDVAAQLFKRLTRDGMKIRMGIAFGPGMAHRDQNDLPNMFGYNINTATRVMNAARPNQILIHPDFATLVTMSSDVPELSKLPKASKFKHGVRTVLYNYHKAGLFGVPGPRKPKHK